ncbi:hypothetical protein BKA70DRAFT_1242294 [Coprinopsis sp. MPI-PUGE-AT-0042]|nr:hypothetical protein BKA70DRAFT_1242294 [Coprinopsis sp. MPI-PUGE-AT-0042]
MQTTAFLSLCLAAASLGIVIASPVPILIAKELDFTSPRDDISEGSFQSESTRKLPRQFVKGEISGTQLSRVKGERPVAASPTMEEDAKMHVIELSVEGKKASCMKLRRGGEILRPTYTKLCAADQDKRAP